MANELKKDIFIDNNIAKNFANPLDPEYKKLLKWLMENHPDDEQKSCLVVSQKLLAEYHRSSLHATSATNIAALINTLLREKRLKKISNDQIKQFKQEHFTKQVEKKMLSNNEDRDHIPVVLLSHRRFALTFDKGLTQDLENFPGFTVTVVKRPQDLPYSA
ncbi:MAG: hypothetical protein MUF71_09135 [Candidatus Kapabacteria bacterium]|jgi:hypothetical protein|nr:hypothetical protein [Candidatus Kapabacteria bacterium]